LKVGARRNRVALSESVGAVLSIAVTVIAGASLFGFVNSQARVSELNYANAIGTTNAYLAENFKVADIYFASTTQMGIWVYNTGNINFQTFSVRLYDSASLINILYNYTGSTSTTDRVFDLKAGPSDFHSTCRLSGSTYENPALSTVSTQIQNAVLLLVTIPPTTTNCPSYGQTFSSGTTYSIVLTGLYGNAVTYYQVK
jgi:hypothetical protein